MAQQGNLSVVHMTGEDHPSKTAQNLPCVQHSKNTDTIIDCTLGTSYDLPNMEDIQLSCAAEASADSSSCVVNL